MQTVKEKFRKVKRQTGDSLKESKAQYMIENMIYDGYSIDTEIE